MQYGVRLCGSLVHDPGWACEGDVIRGFHGVGVTRAVGALVARTAPDQPWRVVRSAPEEAP